MPWVSIPFKSERKEIAKNLNVTGIPALIIMNKVHNTVVDMDGRK